VSRALVIEQELTEDAPGFIGIVVLVETVWVLQRLSRASAEEIRETVSDLVGCRSMVVENRDVVARALAISANSSCGFADSTVALMARRRCRSKTRPGPGQRDLAARTEASRCPSELLEIARRGWCGPGTGSCWFWWAAAGGGAAAQGAASGVPVGTWPGVGGEVPRVIPFDLPLAGSGGGAGSGSGSLTLLGDAPLQRE